MAGITKRWQGDWVVKAGFGKTQDWHVKGIGAEKGVLPGRRLDDMGEEQEGV